MLLLWDDVREQFMDDRRPFKEPVLELYSPLVEYRAKSDMFHLIHLSVREFIGGLEYKSSISERAAQFLISRVMHISI